MIECETQSEITIYKNAIDKESKRPSTSSEECDTSDELIDPIAFVEKEVQSGIEEPQPGTSRSHSQPDRRFVLEKSKTGAKDRAIEASKKRMHESETLKARIYDVTGNENQIDNTLNRLRLDHAMQGGRSMDDSYMLVASHVEDSIRAKILNHEYIDFAKLLRRDKPGMGDEDGQKMMMVNKGGLSYWVPMQDRNGNISSYQKWEQAYRVFLDIYTGQYPERTTEFNIII